MTIAVLFAGKDSDFIFQTIRILKNLWLLPKRVCLKRLFWSSRAVITLIISSSMSRAICSVFIPCPADARTYIMATSIFIYNSSMEAAVSDL